MHDPWWGFTFMVWTIAIEILCTELNELCFWRSKLSSLTTVDISLVNGHSTTVSNLLIEFGLEPIKVSRKKVLEVLTSRTLFLPLNWTLYHWQCDTVSTLRHYQHILTWYKGAGISNIYQFRFSSNNESFKICPSFYLHDYMYE